MVVAAGAVDHEGLVDVLVDGFEGGLKGSGVNRVTPDHNSGLNIVEGGGEQVHLALSFPGVRYGHGDGAAMIILNSYLGVGSSSRLFQEIREKRGLVYNIYSYNQSLGDVGVFTIIAASGKGSVEEVVEVTLGEVEKVKSGLSGEVLETVKQKTIGMFILGSESNQRRMHQMGVSTLRLGRPRTVDEMVGSMEEVTVEDIARVSDRVLDMNRLNLTVLGMSRSDAQGLGNLMP